MSISLSVHGAREGASFELFERSFTSDGLGVLRIVATDVALVAITFAEHRWPHGLATRPLSPASRHDVLDDAARELEEYFLGVRTQFSVPLAPAGTAFQRAVWDALTAIPHGETRSYSDIAVAIDRPRAVRAVGAANALNPLSIIVPCHRVIGRSGELTGYSGGIARKRWLLDHERSR